VVVDRLKAEMAERSGLFRELVDRFGSGVLDVVSRRTIEQTQARLETADLERRDLDSVMELLWDQMVPGTEFVVEERSSEVLRLRVTKCLFADEMRRLGAADVGDAFYCSYDHGFCRGLNPAIRFTRTKTLMNGAECCNHTYELERD
jgi:predicted ArsR family transcriptional regulator